MSPRRKQNTRFRFISHHNQSSKLGWPGVIAGIDTGKSRNKSRKRHATCGDDVTIFMLLVFVQVHSRSLGWFFYYSIAPALGAQGSRLSHYTTKHKQKMKMKQKPIPTPQKNAKSNRYQVCTSIGHSMQRNIPNTDKAKERNSPKGPTAGTYLSSLLPKRVWWVSVL